MWSSCWHRDAKRCEQNHRQEPLHPQGAAWCARKPVGFPGLLGIRFMSWHPEQVLYSRVSAIRFTKHTVCGPAGYGEKLENSESRASDSQSKNDHIYSFLMSSWGLWWIGSAGDGRYSSRQEAEPQPPAASVWAARLHSGDGAWSSVHNTSLQSSSCLWLSWATEQALINHVLEGGSMVSTIQWILTSVSADLACTDYFSPCLF